MRGGYHRPTRQEEETAEARRRLQAAGRAMEEKEDSSHERQSEGGRDRQLTAASFLNRTAGSFVPQPPLTSNLALAGVASSQQLPLPWQQQHRTYQQQQNMVSIPPTLSRSQADSWVQEQRMAIQRAQLQPQLQAQLQMRARFQAQSRVEALLAQESQIQEQIRLLRQRHHLQDTNTTPSFAIGGLQPRGGTTTSAAMPSASSTSILPQSLATSEGRPGSLLPPSHLSSPTSRANNTTLPFGRGAGAYGDSRSWNLSNSIPRGDSSFERISYLTRSDTGRGVGSDLALQAQFTHEHAAGKGSKKDESDDDDDEEVEEGGEGQVDDEVEGVDDDEYFRANPRDAVGSNNETEGVKPKRKREPFPLKLYRMLYEAEKNGQADIFSFAPHGKSFMVHKPKEFVAIIMPKYFAAGRMNTFLKQLNLYAFKRITVGPEKGGYFHEKFEKGKRHMCNRIKRKRATVITKRPPTDRGANSTGSAGFHNDVDEGPLSPGSKRSSTRVAKGSRQASGSSEAQQRKAAASPSSRLPKKR